MVTAVSFLKASAVNTTIRECNTGSWFCKPLIIWVYDLYLKNAFSLRIIATCQQRKKIHVCWINQSLNPYRETALSIIPLKKIEKNPKPQVKVCCVKITVYLCLLHPCLRHCLLQNLFSALVFSDSCKSLIPFHTSHEFLIIWHMMLNHNSRLTILIPSTFSLWLQYGNHQCL